MSPASGDFTPASGATNVISVTRPSIATGPNGAVATSWAVYFSTATDPTMIRNCNSTSAPVPSAPASVSSANCTCLPNGGLQQASNATGAAQTNRLMPDGTIGFSQADGTVQQALTPEHHVVDFTQDVIPRFSPDAGANTRSVDWNSATVYYVDDTLGAIQSNALGRTVFSTLEAALGAITDSSYTKPYVIKLLHLEGSLETAVVIDKPYIWLQGDGSTSIRPLRIIADGARVSGVATARIDIGDQGFEAGSDIDNIWVTNNTVTDGSGHRCGIYIQVGGSDRHRSIHVSNNRVGKGPSEPSIINNCIIDNGAIVSDGSTSITISDNYVYSSNCLHGFSPLEAYGYTSDTRANTRVISTRNTFVCGIPAFIKEEPGENYACIMVGFNFGHLVSVDDVCLITKQVTETASSYYYIFAETDQSYVGMAHRSADFINPTFLISLPGAHHGGDHIAYFLIDAPQLTFTVTNPRYRELALGSGWAAAHRNFALVGGARTPPPSSANTFLRWDNVVEAPGDSIEYYLGASAASITTEPMLHVLPEAMGKSMVITGADLPGVCIPNELRYDTGGATKEICLCSSSASWNWLPLGPHVD